MSGTWLRRGDGRGRPRGSGAAAALVVVASCGYAPPRSEAPEGIRTIAVPTFGTRVAHSAVGAWVAEAVRRQMVGVPSIRLASPSRADASLVGEVLAVEEGPSGLGVSSAGPVAALSGTALVVRARLVRRNGELVADLGSIRARAVRSFSQLPDDERARADRALRDAAHDAGRRIVRLLLDSP